MSFEYLMFEEIFYYKNMHISWSASLWEAKKENNTIVSLTFIREEVIKHFWDKEYKNIYFIYLDTCFIAHKIAKLHLMGSNECGSVSAMRISQYLIGNQSEKSFNYSPTVGLLRNNPWANITTYLFYPLNTKLWLY